MSGACRGTNEFAHLSCILEAFRTRKEWLDLSCQTCEKQYSGPVAVAAAQLALQVAEQGTDEGEDVEAPDVAVVCSNLGKALCLAGDPRQALPHLQRALRLYEHMPDANVVEVALTLEFFSDAQIQLGCLVPGINLLERALSIKERALGPQHLEVACTLDNLGYARLQLLDEIGSQTVLHWRSKRGLLDRSTWTWLARLSCLGRPRLDLVS